MTETFYYQAELTAEVSHDAVGDQVIVGVELVLLYHQDQVPNSFPFHERMVCWQQSHDWHPQSRLSCFITTV